MSASCTYGGGNCGPTVTTQPVVTVPSTTPPVHADSGLPFTGGDVVGLSFIGCGLLAAGIALVRAGRRAAHTG